MLNFNAFTIQDLQKLKAMMQQFEHSNIDSNRMGRKIIDRELKSRFMNNRVEMSPVRKSEAMKRKANRPLQQVKNQTCPDCGSVEWYKGADLFDNKITLFYWCKSCTYGELVK